MNFGKCAMQTKYVNKMKNEAQYSPCYLLCSSSHPSQVKNSISFTQIHRLRRLCSDDYIDIKSLTEGNGLCTSVYYKPTDLPSYLLYSSSHSSHGKNSIPFSQFLRLRRLHRDDSDFSEKSGGNVPFSDKRGYSVSVVQAGHHRAQQIDRQ